MKATSFLLLLTTATVLLFSCKKDSNSGVVTAPNIASVFTDANFRDYVVATYGSNGAVTASELSGVKTLDIHGKSIASLAGISYFTGLTSLNCDSNSLTTVDISKNTALTTLNIAGNKLTALNLSGNTALTALNCGGNQLSVLDISSDSNLVSVNCSPQPTLDTVYVWFAPPTPPAGVTITKDAVAMFVKGGSAAIAIHVYACGYYTDNATVATAFYYKDSTLVNLPLQNIGGVGVQTGTMYVSGSDVYIPGTNIVPAVYWKNGTENILSVTGGTKAQMGVAMAAFASGSDIYFAGQNQGTINQDGSVIPGPVYWKNGTQVNLPQLSDPYNNPGNIATAIYVSGGNVYTAGIDSAYGVYWVNSTEYKLPGSSAQANAQAFSIYATGSDVYAAGFDAPPGGIAQAVYWKNGTEIKLPVIALASWVQTVYINGSDVYVAGIDGRAPVYWKNGVEVGLPSSAGGTIYSIYVNGSDVYVAGTDGDNIVYYKNGVETVLANYTSSNSNNQISSVVMTAK